MQVVDIMITQEQFNLFRPVTVSFWFNNFKQIHLDQPVRKRPVVNVITYKNYLFIIIKLYVLPAIFSMKIAYN
jgi:hypothetical protein